jgi:hypothetical protein
MKPLIPEPVFDPETVLLEAPSSRLCAHVAKDGRPLPKKSDTQAPQAPPQAQTDPGQQTWP